MPGVRAAAVSVSTPARGSCGAHRQLPQTEYAESITDIFPSGGWLDKNGSEIGDKCAWSSASGNIILSTGTFPVQPLWSNAFNAGAGGCAMSY